jgi:hypothetical protein
MTMRYRNMLGMIGEWFSSACEASCPHSPSSRRALDLGQCDSSPDLSRWRLAVIRGLMTDEEWVIVEPFLECFIDHLKERRSIATRL